MQAALAVRDARRTGDSEGGRERERDRRESENHEGSIEHTYTRRAAAEALMKMERRDSE